MDKQILI